ncbi:hypothetical protein JCM33374_g3151 [Metschnikowia sp. JCM 33374]|nr:hypothetical protein JCM33374_g3151 [Metschnikowia sp. JCM 33374]
MLAKSATPVTPVTRPKSQVNDSYTWVKQWYTPLENSTTGSSSNCRLKGWVKTTSAISEPAIAISSDTYDLDKYSFLNEPSNDVLVTEVKPAEESGNSDLKSALSMDKREDQVSSLSGLGM